MLAKFSALALVPITIILLTAYALRTRNVGRALLVLCMLLAGAYAAIHATYAFCGAPGVGEFFLPDSYVAGLRSQLASRHAWPAFLAGNFRPRGWWYYYPVAILVKTPVAVLVLSASGLILYGANRCLFYQNDIFILVPLALFLGGAMAVKFNIGLRYILPIYPFILLVAGKACARLLNDPRRSLLLVPAVLLLVEFCWVYPGPNLPSSISWWADREAGGPDFWWTPIWTGVQDLKHLKHWMNDHDVGYINLCYFGIADPAYYGIHCARLPGHPVVARVYPARSCQAMWRSA